MFYKERIQAKFERYCLLISAYSSVTIFLLAILVKNMLYKCIFLIYILLIYFIPSTDGWMRRKHTSKGFGVVPYKRFWIQTRRGDRDNLRPLKNCSTVLSNSSPEPCVYSCNKKVWIEKNMTQVLRDYGDLRSAESVASNQEIILVPMCSCSNTCPHSEKASYNFTIINSKTGAKTYITHAVKFCKC